MLRGATASLAPSVVGRAAAAATTSLGTRASAVGGRLCLSSSTHCPPALAAPSLIAHFSSTATSAATSHRKQVDRPLSPHVTIYRFPLTAITSITTRATGVGLTVGLYTTAIYSLFAAPGSVAEMIEACKSTVPILVPVAKATVAFPFVFHYLSGIRHLIWDATAEGLTLPQTHRTSQLLVGSSIALTAVLAFLTV
ncbi:Succinate dehydrogenase cytochrome b556 subunit [Balamuthia mandrillaris]